MERQLKVLVVEDDPGFRCLMQEFLIASGFAVEGAESATEGIKRALSFKPDLILLDYELGDMTGYDAACSLRYMAATRDTPLMLLSALGADPLLVGCFRRLRTCRGVLVKTFPLEKILMEIRRALAEGGGI